MWSGLDVHMNGELVSTCNQKYMYKSYFETILNNGHSTKEYQLKTAGFYGDQGDKDKHFEEFWNQGMENRWMAFRNRQVVELRGLLHCDLWNILGSIVNGVEISITLIPNMDSVRIQSLNKNKYGRLVIDEIYLWVCKYTFAKELMLAHSEVMEQQDCTYPFIRTEVRAYNGVKGWTELPIENPYESKIPYRLLVGMVDADSYIGRFGKNPLNFQHYNCSYAGVTINDQNIAKPPYVLDPENNRFIEPFTELYILMNKHGQDMDLGITMDDYKEGFFILPFNVSPSASATMEYLSKKEGGNLCLYLQFKRGLPHNITVITYATFPMELRIDAARNCRVVPL